VEPGGGGGGLAPSNINNRTLCQNDYNFLFCFATAMLEFVGHVINCWKGVFKTFPIVYYKPPHL
jgi:hypothetical protein